MKKTLAAFIAAVLMMSACGGSDDATDEASPETTVAEETSTGEETDASSDGSSDAASEGSDADDTTSGATGDLSDDELALATALTATATADGGTPFTTEEIQCTNEAIVANIGLDTLNSYGITVDDADDTLLPDEFDVQQKAVTAITSCIDIGATFRSLAPPDCEIPLSDEEMGLAMEYDFLSGYAEYDNPAAADASAAMQDAIAVCDAG